MLFQPNAPPAPVAEETGSAAAPALTPPAREEESAVEEPTPTLRPPTAAGAGKEIGAILGSPGKKVWPPNEIVKGACRLSGVAGALITMHDGLLVAAELPAYMNSENVAAFVPQSFGRSIALTVELKMPDSNCLTLLMQSQPLQIYKANMVYFAVLGRMGEELPQSQLAVIASHLSAHS